MGNSPGDKSFIVFLPIKHLNTVVCFYAINLKHQICFIPHFINTHSIKPSSGRCTTFCVNQRIRVKTGKVNNDCDHCL